MIRYLAVLIATQANYVPAKGGVSSVFSPRMLMEQHFLDYQRNCLVPFGSYVQASVATTNTPRGRTRDAIYLGPADSVQGGHEVMTLDTVRLLSTPTVMKLPVTDLVTQAVEEIA